MAILDESTSLKRGFHQDRLLVVTVLSLLTLLAWLYLLSGAGMNTGSAEMFSPLLPLISATPEKSPLQWTSSYFLIIFLMWWVMMIAMMLPAAIPVVLLYLRLCRYNSVSRKSVSAIAAILSFISGYLTIWFAFSLVATALHYLLEQAGWLSRQMYLSEVELTAGVLFLAGAYQLTPIKDTCLRHCQNPVRFIVRYMAPGPRAAMRMGLIHGLFCVGCCWLIMSLLFVSGVMNMLWLIILTLVVISEKLLLKSAHVSRLFGIVLMTSGILVILYN